MRDEARIDGIVRKLRKAWHASPDLRLGQLVYVAVTRGLEPANPRFENVWSTEDEDTERGLDRMLSDRAGNGEKP